MLRYRLIFGSLMIAALLGLFYLDNRLDQINLTGTFAQRVFLGRTYLPAGLLMLGFVVVLIGLGSRELCRIFHAEQIDADPAMIWLSGTIGCVLIYILPYTLDSQVTIAIYASFMVTIFVLSLLRYSWRGRTQGVVTVAAVTMFALIYIGTLPGFYLAIRRWHSAWVVAAIIGITKACDTGAYFIGRAVGRNKLIPWLSPGKTWEGFIGGLLTSAVLATLLAAIGNRYGLSGHYDAQRQFTHYYYPLWLAGAAGLLIGAVGQIGDLVASLFKRDAGIKDSGRSIPGFGGLIDIMDSPIFVAPLAYWLLTLSAAIGHPIEH